MKRFLLISLLSALSSPLPALTFAEFMAGHSLSGSDALATADPDLDRLPNLLEYALDGLSPIVSDAGHASLPQPAFFRRTADALGAWEHTGTQPSALGTGGVWHYGLTFRPRPQVVGIRYIPEMGDSSSLTRWFGGRSAVLVQMAPGFTIQAVGLTQAQRLHQHFARLRVEQDATVTDPAAGLGVAGTAAQALDIETPASEPRVIAGGTTSTGTDDDLTTSISTGATSATDWRWAWQPASTNIQQVNLTRSSSDPAVISPATGDNQLWTYQSNGSAVLTMRTDSSTYTASITTSTATGQTVTSITGAVTGSLRDHVTTAITSRLAGTPATVMPLYSTRTPGSSTYVRNTSNWADDLDLSPHAAYNSASSTAWAGATLISPIHILTADHVALWMPIGATLHFVSPSNVVCSRTIASAQTITGTDIRICKLDSDVALDINFARILPATWAQKLPSLLTQSIPGFRITQAQQLTISELADLTDSAHFHTPPAARLPWYQPTVIGDSSTPDFLFINGQMVVISARWKTNEGPSVTANATAINAAMTALGGGYQLTEISLLSFPTY